MTDWFRRTEWSGEEAQDFEARLARARPSSRAQYLSLQGYALIAKHPDVAEGLLRRAVDLAERSERPRAACYLALARIALRDIDGALAAYDEAIEAERRDPAFRSSAAAEQALLIAIFRRSERYADALDRLWLAGSEPFGLVEFERETAEALIRADLGECEQARLNAQAALAVIADSGMDAEWAGISFREIRKRLEAIA